MRRHSLPITVSLFIASVLIAALLSLAGCQGSMAVAPPPAQQPSTPAAPAQLKEPKFLFVAAQGGDLGGYQVFSVDSSGAMTAMGSVPPTFSVAKELQFQSSSNTLYASTEATNPASDPPGLNLFHFDPAKGSLTGTGSVQGFGDWTAAPSVNGKFLYANGFHTAESFSMDLTSGSLAQLSSIPDVSESIGQWMLKMHPSGRFIYGSGLYTLSPPGPNQSNAIFHLTGFSVDPQSGAAALLPGFPALEQLNGGVAIHPSGKFVFANGVDVVYTYMVNPSSGAVQLIGSAPYDGKTFPQLVPVVEASGRFLYLCCTPSALFGFSIDQTSGMLTPLPNFPMTVVAPDTDPEAPIRASGHFLFLGLGGNINPVPPAVAVFRIGDDGSLAPVTGSPFGVSGGNVRALAVAEQ